MGLNLYVNNSNYTCSSDSGRFPLLLEASVLFFFSYFQNLRKSQRLMNYIWKAQTFDELKA
jgi:hypothetical protein